MPTCRYEFGYYNDGKHGGGGGAGIPGVAHMPMGMSLPYTPPPPGAAKAKVQVIKSAHEPEHTEKISLGQTRRGLGEIIAQAKTWESKDYLVSQSHLDFWFDFIIVADFTIILCSLPSMIAGHSFAH